MAATISAVAFALSAQAAGTRAAEAELGLPGLDVQVHPWWPLVVVFGLLAVGCGLLVVLRDAHGPRWAASTNAASPKALPISARLRKPGTRWIVAWTPRSIPT